MRISRSGVAKNAIAAGIAYFALVFAAGFMLGTIRTLVLVPNLGAFAAVVAELPFMLAIAWIACRWLVARFPVTSGRLERLLMGAVALALLLGAEFVLSVALLGGGASAFVAGLHTPEGALGLVGQIAFAAMPLLMRRRRPQG